MYVKPAFDLPRIFKEMEVNKAWVDLAKTNSRADWKDPLGQKLYLKTSAEGFSVQQATDMLNNANELSPKGLYCQKKRHQNLYKKK
jgi:hypothetical protein